MSSWAPFLKPASVVVLLFACAAALPQSVDAQSGGRRLDKTLSARARVGMGESRVIVTFKHGWDATEDAKRLGAQLVRRLRNGSRVMRLSNTKLEQLANHPAVERVTWDRPVFGLPVMESGGRKRGGKATIAGTKGDGIGVAIIDSGITAWHDELTYLGTSRKVIVKGGQRVAAFVDYTQGDQVLEDVPPYDDYGHGTFVAGIIAGNGLGSGGSRMGAAPGAHLVVLKVLDQHGKGSISDVVDALTYVRENKNRLNIRVVNMSIAAAVPEPGITEDLEEDGILDDELAAATRQTVDAGIVVVAAAGNLGFNSEKQQPQYGGITAPGNAPWVLTVGAHSQENTGNPRDDVIAPFSSRGPTAYDYLAKPDVVAPGWGVPSLAERLSKLFERTGPDDESGRYLTLSGTSVAAPAVSGLIARMAEAYPNLTPNMAKAIVQYTARLDPDYDALTQGAGYLNPDGALQLTQYFAKSRPGSAYPTDKTWGRTIIWGNYMVRGGLIWPAANAWSLDTVWGAMPQEDGDNVVWGTLCAPEDCDNIVWGTFDDGFNIVWGTAEDGDNIVWGTRCGEDCDNIVWGTRTEDGDNIVWGTTCDTEACDDIVWGTSEDIDNIVWGTDCHGEDCDNIVWGTRCDSEDCDNIVWGTAEDGFNIVWGTSCRVNGDCEFNIVWGTDWTEAIGEFNIVWGTTSAQTTSGVQTSTVKKKPARRSLAPPWLRRK
jgi:serine protease AprX